MDKLKKDTGSFFNELARHIDVVFVKAGISFVPKIVRYLAVIFVLVSPIIAVIVMLCMGDEEEAPKTKTKKVTANDAIKASLTNKAAAAPSKQREKLD